MLKGLKASENYDPTEYSSIFIGSMQVFKELIKVTQHIIP